MENSQIAWLTFPPVMADFVDVVVRHRRHLLFHLVHLSEVPHVAIVSVFHIIVRWMLHRRQIVVT